MKVTNLVGKIVGACERFGRRILRGAVRSASVSTTVGAWMRSQGWDDAAVKQWGSAVGRLTAKLARQAGFNPPEVWIESPWAERVYQDATFMVMAWNTPDKKGRTYAYKVESTHSKKG